MYMHTCHYVHIRTLWFLFTIRNDFIQTRAQPRPNGNQKRAKQHPTFQWPPEGERLSITALSWGGAKTAPYSSADQTWDQRPTTEGGCWVKGLLWHPRVAPPCRDSDAKALDDWSRIVPRPKRKQRNWWSHLGKHIPGLCNSRAQAKPLCC